MWAYSTMLPSPHKAKGGDLEYGYVSASVRLRATSSET